MRMATVRTVLKTMLLVGALVLTGCAGSGAPKAPQASESVKVGAVLSLTGQYAALGASEKNALELEVARINAAGGAGGRKLELVIEDDGTDEAKAVSAAAKLIEQDGVVAILGATGTGQSMAIRNDIVRAGIPQISMAGGTVITQQFDSLVFQTPWSNTLVVPYVLAYMKSQGVSKVGLISDAGGYGKDGRAIIQKEAAKAGLELVSDQTFNPGDPDASAQLTKIKAAKPDAVLMWTAGKDAATIIKNARQIGLDAPFYGGSGQARVEFPAGAGSAAEGFRFGTGKILLPESYGKDTEAYKVAADFLARYEKQFGAKPDIFAGHAYDAIAILANALERTSGDTDPAKLRDAIEQTKGLVGIGGTFTFSATDHNGLTEDDLYRYEIKDGAWVPGPGAQ